MRYGRRRATRQAVETELTAEAATERTRTGANHPSTEIEESVLRDLNSAHQTRPASRPAAVERAKERRRKERGWDEEEKNRIVVSGRPNPAIVPSNGIKDTTAATEPTEAGVNSRADAAQKRNPKAAASRVFTNSATEFLANWGLCRGSRRR
jgi:hypothetical protein